MIRLLGTIVALVTLQSAEATTFVEFRSVDGKLLADNSTFYIKGVNWFGFETIELVAQGLWPSATTIENALDLFQEYDINAVRLPLAMDSVLNDPKVDNDQTAGMPSLAGKSYLEVLDVFVNECRKRNMLVMFDSHRIEAAEPDFPDIAEPKDIIPALEVLATRYCDNPAAWNVFAIDIKNEPKGKASWGTGDADTDWDLNAAKIGNAVLEKCERLLIFVEGVQTNIEGVELEWGQAGGSLQGTKDHPVKLKNMERLVYSPHAISPGVDYKSPWWSVSSFPANMPKIWDKYFGFVPKETGNAIVVGSWGAKMKGDSKKWAVTLATYLTDNSIGSFYWAFNPQSADTGGLVKDDWVTPIDERFDLLAPLPTSSLDSIIASYAKCTSKCDGYGECVDGTCVCYTGWSGPQCEICSAGDAVACNNAGTCQTDNTCMCDEDVEGKYCDGADCDNVDCGDSENAMCYDGSCVCKYHCVGTTCTTCAANESALATVGSVLCDNCPSPDEDSMAPKSFFSSVMFGVSVSIIVALYLH